MTMTRAYQSSFSGSSTGVDCLGNRRQITSVPRHVVFRTRRELAIPESRQPGGLVCDPDLACPTHPHMCLDHCGCIEAGKAKYDTPFFRVLAFLRRHCRPCDLRIDQLRIGNLHYYTGRTALRADTDNQHVRAITLRTALHLYLGCFRIHRWSRVDHNWLPNPDEVGHQCTMRPGAEIALHPLVRFIIERIPDGLLLVGVEGVTE